MDHRSRVGWATAAGLLLLLSSVVSAAGVGPALAGEPIAEFQIVAHPDSSPAEVNRTFVADAFLKKVTRWPNGEAIHAVDLRPDSPARQKFSEKVLRRSVFAVRNYWQQRIFTGRGVPPPELQSDDAVLGYVRRHPGAVGYVSVNADISSVRLVTVR